jgi:TRAP transporter TAXI family solute receptor
MTKHLGRRGLIAASAALLMLAAACGEGGDSDDAASGGDGGGTAQEQLDLTMGGSSSSSSVFALITAEARLAEDADGAMSINIRETGASNENIALLQDGSAQFGLSGLSTVVQAHKGLGDFEGADFPELCSLFVYLNNAEFITVRADAGIDSVEDLDGKPFAPGFQGSAVHDDILAYLEALDIHPEVFEGSLEDITNAMKDGRIVGFGKSANGLGPDASMLDVASAVPVKAIGFTKDQVDDILAADPNYELLFDFAEIPKGTIYDNDSKFMTGVVHAVYFSTNEALPEDDAFRVTKAMFEALDEAATQTNYAGAKGITAEDTTKTTDALPLCDGSKKYFDELS